MEPSAALDKLIGEELSSVSFVRDYVEFDFNGPVLRALSNPIVRIGAESFTFPGTGSRDALCSLNGISIGACELEEGSHIRLLYQGGASVTIPLDEGSRRGPESANFQPADPEDEIGMYIW